MYQQWLQYAIIIIVGVNDTLPIWSHGRKARLPVDIDTEAVHDPDVKLKQYANKLKPNVDEIASKRKKMEENVKMNIENKQTSPASTFAITCWAIQKKKGMYRLTRWLVA